MSGFVRFSLKIAGREWPAVLTICITSNTTKQNVELLACSFDSVPWPHHECCPVAGFGRVSVKFLASSQGFPHPPGIV